MKLLFPQIQKRKRLEKGILKKNIRPLERKVERGKIK
jgi:hypothetical protein